jgi:uncharacterized protein (DUF2252 family)
MVLEFLDAYHHSMHNDNGEASADGQPELGGVASLFWATARGTFKRLLKRYTRHKNGKWRIRLRKDRITGIGMRNARLVREAVTTFGWKQNWSVLDVARRHSGIGSLGLRRFIVLVEEAGKPEPILLDVKEACPSALAALADPSVSLPENPAERVVLAQRQLQAKPTAQLAVLGIGDRWFRLHTMIPDENRSSLERLQEHPAKLREAVATAGRLTARSQHRGCRLGKVNRFAELQQWADSPALESVLAAAVRFADWVQRDYAVYVKAFRSGEFG